MSALLDELNKYMGVESEPVVYSIDEGAIKFFAESLMDPDPLYWDEAYARTTKHKRIVAPPTFYGGATSACSMKSDDPLMISAVYVPVPPGWVGLYAGDDFEFFASVEPGDTLTCREKVVDIYERQGRSGHLIFVVREKGFTNQHGDLVLVRRGTIVYRGPSPEEEGD